MSEAREGGVARRFVIHDDEGAWVETHVCESREHAIRLFCYPALIWSAFEADGWTCTEEPPLPRQEPQRAEDERGTV